MPVNDSGTVGYRPGRGAGFGVWGALEGGTRFGVKLGEIRLKKGSFIGLEERMPAHSIRSRRAAD